MAKQESMLPVIGAWAFVIGLVVAVVAGFAAPANANVALLLGVIGLVIGVINVTDKEIVEFLVAAIALTVAASSFAEVLQGIPGVQAVAGSSIQAILAYIVTVVAPAAAVVALKAIYDVARSA